jgi:thiol-disulfide isomerase/thioredoxin
MNPLMLGLAVIGAALWFSGCTRKSPERSVAYPESRDHTEYVNSEDEIMQAGSLTGFIKQKMKPDGHYRMFVLFSEHCPACEKLDKQMKELQKNEGLLDYIRINVDLFKKLPFPPFTPISIVQYSDCDQAKFIIGTPPEGQLRRMIMTVTQLCEQIESREEELPPPQEESDGIKTLEI